MKRVLSICLLFISAQLLAQIQTERVYDEEYGEFISGVYTLKSTDSSYFSTDLKVIEPEITLNQTDRTEYLVVGEQPIVLFKNSSPQGKEDIAGVLMKSSFIETITSHRKRVLRDFTKKWSITHEVWSEVVINGQTYYTDIKLHDFLGYNFSFSAQKQTLTFVAKRSGYDGNYDTGYPENWHFIVLDEKKEIIFDSGELLDFRCNCEFGIEQLSESNNGELIHEVSYNLVEAYLHGTSYNMETKELIDASVRFTWSGRIMEFLKNDQ
ncbi:hypothetical protein [Roseivirga echinicomitans]|uniref:Uncharacterized protein n=1 Tax=Roseivirga echinicomitans TaxID=296218 RepID=A0A150XU99_9BACT|nr:hypothetical protein [Roseivirga echinicomitans]KYG82311.1 hypothetical protein AWN68_15845 [Roseivirga echinicomitans]